MLAGLDMVFNQIREQVWIANIGKIFKLMHPFKFLRD